MRPAVPVLLSIVAVAWVGTQAPAISKEVSAGGRPNSALEAHETHAAASLIGQMRTNVSSWLWLKSDLYLHNGVEMRPLTDAEKRAGREVEKAADDGHEQLYSESEVTIVPSKENDFRGWFGDVERATTAFKDMHNHRHNDPKAAMPLFRLMTWIDPGFVPGWVTGATIIIRDNNQQATAAALRFLRAGLDANPDSVQVLDEIGYVQLTRRQDLTTAAKYFERACAAGVSNFKLLDDDEREALEEAFRWLALCDRDLGRHQALREDLARGLSLFPDDPVLLKTFDAPPLLLSDKGQRMWSEKERQEAIKLAPRK